MGKYSFKDFVADRVTVHVLKEDWNKFLDLCKKNHIRVCDDNYRAGGYMQSFGNDLSGAWMKNGDPIVEFRDMEDVFPPCKPNADPWADFIAGRCYLRVTKAEWAEFVRRCKAANLKWFFGCLDAHVKEFERGNNCARVNRDGCVCLGNHSGNKGYGDRPIHPFSAAAPEPVKADRPKPEQSATSPRKYKVGDLFEMTAHHNSLSPGDVVKLVYDDGSDRKHYARLTDGLMQWVCDNELKPYRPEQKIIITTDGHTTTAKLIDGKQTIKTATARCNEGDKFDFEVGASISMNRLIHGKDFPNASPDHFAAWAKQLRALADEVAKAIE